MSQSLADLILLASFARIFFVFFLDHLTLLVDSLSKGAVHQRKQRANRPWATNQLNAFLFAPMSVQATEQALIRSFLRATETFLRAVGWALETAKGN